MKVDLSKDELIKVVKGDSPSYELMEHPLVKSHGKYYGGFNDYWEWDTYSLRKLTEEELCQIYKLVTGKELKLI